MQFRVLKITLLLWCILYGRLSVAQPDFEIQNQNVTSENQSQIAQDEKPAEKSEESKGKKNISNKKSQKKARKKSERNSPALPQILKHSKQQFSVYQGDSFSIEVALEDMPKKPKINWFKLGNTVCRETKCDFESETWALGTHKISLIIQNNAGSTHLKFYIRILKAPENYSAGSVVPPLEEASGKHTEIASNDLVIQAIDGRGFSYHHQKLHVVSKKNRILDWVESVRTQQNSVLKITDNSTEEHVLGHSTKVVLRYSEKQRRLLDLLYGDLRSRQFKGQADWSIVVKDWLQIDGDETVDVLVRHQKETDIVQITSIRGNVRVFIAESVGSKFSGRTLTIPAGTQMEFDQKSKDSHVSNLPKGRAILKVLKITTPQYLEKFGSERNPDWGYYLSKDELPQNFPQALVVAERHVEAGDYALAIEGLWGFGKKIEKSYRANLLLGRSYMGLFLNKKAFDYLKAARTLKDSMPEPYFLTGLIYLGEGDFAIAIKYLEDAEENGYEDRQLIYYYLGVANFYKENSMSARSNFLYSEWFKTNNDISESTKKFAEITKHDRLLDLKLFAGVLYDTNVIRVHDDSADNLPEGMDGIASAGYTGGLSLDLYAFEESIGHMKMFFDIQNISWVDPSFSDVMQVDQALGADLNLGFGAERFRDHFISFGLTASAGVLVVGENRATDQLITEVRLGSPKYYDLNLKLRVEQNLDPLPGEDAVLDPTLGETKALGDRSNKRSFYTLEIVPIKTATVSLKMDFFLGEALMTDKKQTRYNHKISGSSLDMDYYFSLRQSIQANFEYRAKKFAEFESSRADSLTSLAIGWKWYYTASLSHLLSVGYESQSSNIDAYQYSRQMMQFNFGLEL